MKRLIIFLLLVLPLYSYAQQGEQGTFILNKDSISSPTRNYFLFDKWRYKEADDAAMALPGYDDSKWPLVSSRMRLNNTDEKYNSFNSIGWFRYHFIADSSIINIPLAICMTQYGASEIYLDGKKMESYGEINGKGSTIYYDPQLVPLTLIVHATGPHVLAVRYANFEAQKNYKIYNRNMAGFAMIIGQARFLINIIHQQTVVQTFICVLLFGIFISLAVLHLFLYLYYRSFKPNLYLSIFCCALGAASLIIFIDKINHTPYIAIRNALWGLVAAMGACFSLSGFINDLFSAKKLRFRIITVLCIITLILFFINKMACFYGYLAMVGVVSLEAIILTIRAIYRRVKGAKIIGVGVLLFTLFILYIFIYTLIHPNFDFNDSTPSGQIIFLLAGCAILSLPISMSMYLAWKFAALNKDLTKELQHVQLLSAQTLEQELEKKQILEHQNERLEQEVTIRTEKIEKQHNELKIEKKKSDDLLLNILPEEVAEELKQKGYSEAKYFDDVTVLFTDFVDFTTAGESMSPGELVSELNVCFKVFDEIISKYNIEKIKTIGDAYMAVCGLPLPQPDHAIKVVAAALEIMQFMVDRKRLMGDKTFEIRIGIHSGSVVAGIVGVKKFAYDIWGDTVNTAARIEQNSLPGKINISQTVYNQVKSKFDCTYRGEVMAKNKGELSMYFVEGRSDSKAHQQVRFN